MSPPLQPTQNQLLVVLTPDVQQRISPLTSSCAVGYRYPNWNNLSCECYAVVKRETDRLLKTAFLRQ